MNRATLLLSALLLSGAGAQSGPLTPAVPATPVTETGQAIPTATELTVELPDRVKEVLISFPRSALNEPVITVNNRTLTGVPDGTDVLFRLREPDRILNVRFDGQLQSPDHVGVAVQYDTGVTETLSGTRPFKPGVTAAPPAATRDGVIRTPVNGPIQRGRSSTNVTTVSTLNEPFTLLLNGAPVPETQIGRRTEDPSSNLITREYIGLPLLSGTNTLTAVTPSGEDEVTVQVAGPAANVRITEQQLLADGFSPVTVTLDVTDRQGQPTVLPNVTVEHTGRLTLITPDANASQAGHQINATNGALTLRFAPVSEPLSTTVTLNVNNNQVSIPLTVAPARKRTVIVLASGTLSGVGTGLTSAGGDIRATIEAPLLGGQLTANVDSRGAHTDTPAEVRNPSLGDRSRETRALTADGPIAARFNHPGVTVTYARNAATDPVFTNPDDGDALNVTTTDATRVSAYYAPYAGNNKDLPVPLNGTRVTRLPDELDPRRARLILTTTTAGVTTSEDLTVGRDYVIDEAGVITFTRPLLSAPDADTTVTVTARGPVRSGVLAPAWQGAVTHEFTDGQINGSVNAGLHIGSGVTYGARLTAADTTGPETFTVDARASATARGTQAQIIATGRAGATTWNVSGQHESSDYDGKNATGTAGQSLNASLQRPVTATFGVRFDTRIRRDPQGFGARVTAEGVYTPNPRQQFTAGVFGGTGTLSGTGLSGSARWNEGPWNTVLTAQQQLNAAKGTYSAQVTRRIPLPDTATPGSELAAGVRAAVTLDNGALNLRGAAVLTGRSGPYTASLEYGLPTASDQNGELRGNVQATFPVTSNLNVGAGFNFAPGTQTLSTDARYTTADTAASAGVDVTSSARDGLGAAVKFSVSRTLQSSVTPLGITADGLSTFTAAGRGHRYSAGVTYRGEQWNTAAYLRYRSGTLTGAQSGQELTAELNTTFHTPRWQTRAGLAGQIQPNGGTLALQGLLTTRYWMTETLAVGAAYRGLYGVSDGAYAQALGVEGTYKLQDAAALSVGYNFGGFTAITAEPTRRGLYVRLDVLLDETNPRDP